MSRINGKKTYIQHAKNPVFEIVHDESVKVYLHMYNGNVKQNPLCVKSCVTKELYISPLFSPTVFNPDANSVLLRAHLYTAVDPMSRKPCVGNCSREREGLYNGNILLAHLSLYNSVNRFYAQNPVFEIVHDEGMKVYLHIYNGNVQQNPLCVESGVTKEFSISPRLSPTIFDPDANSVLLRAHLCPAVDSKPCVRNCSREHEGLYNGNVQQNSLGAASCVSPSLPGSRLRFFISGQIQHLAVQFLTHSSPN